jgi:hypothetical protein
MSDESFLAMNVANAIYEDGRRLGWWPFETRECFDDFMRKHPLSLRGRGTHLLVGLDREGNLKVREIENIADSATISKKAFLLSYQRLTERVAYEHDA